MLQDIHDKAKGWVAGIIIGFVSLTFAMWGISNYFEHGNTDKMVAKVNGDKITESQLNNAYKRLQRQQQALGLNLPKTPEVEKAVKEQVLNGLIQNQVLVQGAEDAKFDVSQQLVESALVQMPMFQVNGQFSQERFSIVISNLMMTEAQYLKQLQHQLLVNQVQTAFTESSFALPSEVSKVVKLSDQKRDISYTVLDKAQVQSHQTITDEAIKAYYEKNKEQFKIPAKVKLSYVELSVKDLVNKVKPTKDQIHEYYTANKNMFETGGMTKTLAEATPQITAILARRMAQQQFATDSDQLANLSYENPNALTKVAKELGLKIKQTGYMTQKGGEGELAKNKEVLAQAFSEDVYKQGYNSNVVSLGDGNQVVVRIADKKPASYKPLQQVKSQVMANIKLDNQKQAAQQEATKILKALQSGSSLAEVAKQFHVTWQHQTNVSRTAKLPAAITQKAFALTAGNQAKLSVGQVTMPNKDVAVVVLNKIIPGKLQDVSKQERDKYKQQIAKVYGNLDFQLFTAGLMKQAKVKNVE